ncbi:MAG TPA: hypothetical protein PLX84_02050, partial [Acidiphilium sp.]|nr:hypothetical protein [Acidiphilium sp.]
LIVFRNSASTYTATVNCKTLWRFYREVMRPDFKWLHQSPDLMGNYLKMHIISAENQINRVLRRALGLA